MIYKTFNVHRVDSTTGSDEVIGSFRTGVDSTEVAVLLQNYANLFEHAKKHCTELKEDMNHALQEGQEEGHIQYFLSADNVYSEKFVVRVMKQKGTQDTLVATIIEG